MEVRRLFQFQLDLLWLNILSLYFPVIGSLSLKPPAEEISNRHLCPDLVSSRKFPAIFSAPNTIMQVALQRSPQPKERTNTYFSRLRSCNFVEQQNNSNATVVRVRSINLNTEPWNFSTPSCSECSKFITFRSWAEYGNGYPVMCGPFDQYVGPFPMILYFHLNDQRISFPLFHPSYGKKRDILDLKYMLIYFSLKKDGVSTCRLQQYILDPLQQGCPSTYKAHAMCGEYNCSELETLYQEKMGVVRDGDFHQQRFIIVNSKTQEKYRVRNFLRQKFVPIVFLLVLIFAYKSYMKAGLRLNDPLPLPVTEMRLRRHHHRHHMRPCINGSTDQFRDIYFDFGPSPIPGLHIPYEPPEATVSTTDTPDARQHCSHAHGKYLGNADPTDAPPPYHSLFPPSYSEATSNPKV